MAHSNLFHSQTVKKATPNAYCITKLRSETTLSLLFLELPKKERLPTPSFGKQKSPALGWASRTKIRKLRSGLRAVFIESCDQVGCNGACVARLDLIALHHVDQ